MRESQRPFGADEPESRRLTPSTGLASDSEVPSDGSNEDFLFHLYRGSELLQDNRVHEAKEELERALHLQPRDTKGQDLLAVVYFRLGLYPRAIAIYEQLRRKSPRDTALLLNLALCYLKTGQPAAARRDLEQLLSVNPAHIRAWGYLGLSCERLGDLEAAQRAFEQGGHGQMAKRMATRRASINAPPTDPDREGGPTREVRDVVAAAYEELDAGELSFAIAEPSSESQTKAPDSWRPIELGNLASSPRTTEARRQDTQKPDTKDGPPPSPDAPPSQEMPATAVGRRPTLIAPVGAPPMPEPSLPLGRIASPRPPSYVLDEAGKPSLRRPVVAVPPIRASHHAPSLDPSIERKKTLPPPIHRPPTPPPPQQGALPPPQTVATFARHSSVVFPEAGRVVLHSSGVALARTNASAGFMARLEAIRASSNGLAMKTLERHAKGKPTGESFGGVGSPVVHAAGEGQLVLAARPGRKISSFVLGDEMCFVREEVLLAFGGELAFENGRLATGEGEFVAVVQLRGPGPVLLESTGDVLTLEVHANRGMSVRREAILGWFGRIVPRALPPGEAPCGQRGLVSFAGEGRVLVTSA